MKVLSALTQAKLKELLHYEPETGVFTWIESTSSRIKIGDIAGNKGVDGYIDIGIYGKLLRAHRLAYLYMTGEWPEMVDHRDGDGLNNKWENLRLASKRENAINSKRSAKNKSGFKGVSWHVGGKKWQAHCGPIYIGLFDTPEMAHAAYLEEAKKTGFERSE